MPRRNKKNPTLGFNYGHVWSVYVSNDTKRRLHSIFEYMLMTGRKADKRIDILNFLLDCAEKEISREMEE